ncbi:cytoskeleton-associated protein 2-like [Sinocyclocheilus anshuiensis]|uniref:cytoskeleton-associated protein 2-like n=1 Tax=Sinocyclocheilus anshuiensis TaxID=1608454 RepID=UPI0007B9EF85|nr:PREDICTED: cytoskeleton-associated protein 2-like [Sinocyclocheilus anshuiensis]XP_016345865.1 PREDICTED: cytoskeleton-associated protein 2-like [Sinocyclocheilus anshuiensis]
MESVVRKSNKENSKPVCGPKKQVICNIVSKQKVICKSAPLQSKNDLKEDISGTREKEKVVRPKAKTNADPTKRNNTLSQAFRTQQTVRHKKLVEEVHKPPSTVSAIQKSKPGTYKGRVVRSKIDCFRKPSEDEKTTEKKVISKPDVTRPKPELSKVRSKSVTSLPAYTKPRVNSALSSRPKSVSDIQLNATEKPVQKSISHKRIPQKFPGTVSQAGVCAPLRSAPLATGRSAISKPSALKKKDMTVQVEKPKTATTEQKVCRPVTSTVSQYKMQIETAEERRAKLAEWLASKGKALKRHPISEKSSAFSLKPKPAPQPKTGPKATIGSQSEHAVQTEAVKPTAALKPDNQTNDIEVPDNKTVCSRRSSNIMNTTLDFLDNSDMDLPVDLEIRMESLVLNLCDKLEAMETPSSCEDGVNFDKSDVVAEKRMEVQMEEQKTDKVFEILEEEELGDEEDITEDTKKAVIKNEDDDQEPKEKKPFASEDDDSDEEMKNTTPEMVGASIVKYNVKTTPYLQSVKKIIECETAPGSGSRRKSTIKDLKFLTPVRRSTRIQRKSSRLPGMLNDHDACVSSLAELVQMEDADANAYIYRKNPALLEDLPDQPEDFAKVFS